MHMLIATGMRFKRTAMHLIGSGVFGMLLTVSFDLVFASSVEAQSLGRLFSTPALRAELDRRRIRESSGILELLDSEPVTLEDLEEQQVVPDTIYVLGGSMRRSDGSYTVWINNVPYAAADLPDHMELVSPYEQGQMRIRDPDSGDSFLVKPGQVLNLTQGQVMEAYQYRALRAVAPQSEPGADTVEETDNAEAEPETDEASGDAVLSTDVQLQTVVGVQQ